MIYVVEPHADDAFLSLGFHIETWTYKLRKQVTIVTVYSGTRKRGAEAEAYARSVGARWVGLGFTEAGLGAKDINAKPRPLPTNVFTRANLVQSPSDFWIGPLSIRHPEHFEVRRRMPSDALYYLDMPYAYTPKNAPLVTKALAEHVVVSWMRPPKRKWTGVSFFKDQSKFFFFNPVTTLENTFEMLLVPSAIQISTSELFTRDGLL